MPSSPAADSSTCCADASCLGDDMRSITTSPPPGVCRVDRLLCKGLDFAELVRLEGGVECCVRPSALFAGAVVRSVMPFAAGGGGVPERDLSPADEDMNSQEIGAFWGQDGEVGVGHP